MFLDERGCEQVDVYPACAAAMESPLFDEGDDFPMWDELRLIHERVVPEQPFPHAAVPDEKLAIDELMAHDGVLMEKVVEVPALGILAGEESNPNRRVDKNPQAALRRFDFFAWAPFSRLRGVSDAVGSVPRRLRRRS